MAFNITPFKSTDDFTMAGFNGKIQEINNGVGAYANEYWWRRRIPSHVQYIEQKSDIQKNYDIIGRGSPLTYSKDIHITSETGEISLVSPTKLELGNGEREDAARVGSALAAEAPCYIQTTYGEGAGIYYLPPGTTYSVMDSTTIRRNFGDYYYVTLQYPASPQGQAVKSVLSNVPAGEWEYLQSSNRSAYPDSGTQDGYEYEYLGIPFDNAVNGVKIETGSYVGTGKYGQANPNTLTFGFAPKLVIFPHISDYNGCPEHLMFYVGTRFYKISNGITGTLEGGELSWYSTTSTSEQFNVLGTTYYYFAIG